MTGFAILLVFYFLGCLLQEVFHIPLPPNVIGLILFTACLFLKWVKVEWVEEASRFLVRHMMLFFAPIVVGVMVFLGYIGKNSLVVGTALLLSTLGVLLITGWTVKAVMAFKRPTLILQEEGEQLGDR